MNKLGFLFFLPIFGCIKLERLEDRDKVFSYDEFRTLVKKEDIAEYLSRNEYDFEQELEKGRDILHILIKKDMEAEVLLLLDKLNALKEEERVEFFSIKDKEEALFLVVDKLWIKSTMKILDMYSNKERRVRLSFGDELNFTLLSRAVMDKNVESLMFVLDLRREYSREIENEHYDNFKFKINKKLAESLEKAYDLVTIRKADKVSKVDKSIGEDSIFVTFLKECLKKKGIKGEVSVEEFLSNLEEEGRKEALIISSCLGDERVLSYLLNLGVKQDKVDENFNTALIYSSYYGRVKASKILIRQGVAVDLANKDSQTPLYIASAKGHKEVVELLLSKGAMIDLANKDGKTPLWAASFWGCKKVVKFLLSKGAKVDSSDKYGVTPLYIASQFGHKEVVELLLAKCTALDLVDQYGNTSLLIASVLGHKEVVKLLLKKGASIDLGNKHGSTPLWAASYNGHKEIVELLIKKGVSIDLAENFFGVTPLSAASQKGHSEVVELLLNKGAAIDLADEYGETPLYMASGNGHKEVVELLLEKGAAIDLADKDGKTPLLIASQNGHKEMVELLLEKGAAINLTANDGRTSLYIASCRGHKEVVELLLEKGAAIDLANYNGTTPLCRASYNGYNEVVELLLTKGADVNKVDLKGKSVLERALLNENEKETAGVIEELLSSCFVEGKGIVLSSNSLIVSEEALNLFNRKIRQNEMSSISSFAKVYRILNDVYSKQFIREIERDLAKSCTTKLIEIIDEIRALNDKEFQGANIKNDDPKNDVSQRFKYEIIDNLNKMFDKRGDLKANAVYDKFKNNREVILNRRVKAGYYKDYTILMLEILKSDLNKVLDRVRELIKEGSDVNAADQSGNTCLMLAIKKNLKEVVEELINNEADINAVNKNGENALMIGIEANSVDMVKKLAPLTNLDHKDIFKNRALMLAMKKIMHINPNSIDSEKRVKEIEEIIDILIKSGAKVTKEVIDLLEEKKGDEIVEKFRLKLVRIFKLDF